MSDVTPYHDSMELAEAQLQQELRAMFEVDSQAYLQTYVTLVQQIQPQSWKADIQELYRSIHTIKGMAVTVEADAVVQVATALEDLLSDLRYQSVAPALADGELINLLEEAGELLTAALQVELVGDAAREAVYPTTVRLQSIRKFIQNVYLPDTNEKTQLFYEFAEQGFDLVVLDLEMALERLPSSGLVPLAALETALQTLQQLQQIGQDLEFDTGWLQLLEMGHDLIHRADSQIWQVAWLPYLHILKDAARQGGKFRAEAATFEALRDQIVLLEGGHNLENGSQAPAIAIPPPDQMANLDKEVDLVLMHEEGIAAEPLDDAQTERFDLDLISLERPDDAQTESLQLDLTGLPAELPSLLPENTAVRDSASDLASLFDVISLAEPTAAADPAIDLDDFLADFSGEDAVPLAIAAPGPAALLKPDEDWDVSAELNLSIPLVSRPLAPTVTAMESERSLSMPVPHEDTTAKVQIPVSLQRLDQASQTLVETLLAARASQGFYQNLQTQLAQLVALAQDSVEYITRLRQVQDEYALLSGSTHETDLSSRPTVERYRQGYAIINRLLENSLRLTEVGAEVSTSARQTATSLNQLDRQILSLQKNVEESRLIPFKTLSFKARGIVRELSTRFKKPAILTVQGANLEIDAGVAQDLEPVLLHLIRNAYDHGLESAEDRKALGKNPQGTIHLSLRRQGSTYLLSVQDDGRGIDAIAIQQLATAKRLPLTQTGTPAELLAVLCQSGFSSRETITDVSGRGVGMDVVANQVSQLGGRLKLVTSIGKGATFQLQIPVPQLLIRCILVRCGDLIVAIPREEIVTTTLWSTLSATPVSDPTHRYTWMMEDAAQSLPGLDLLNYWQQQTTARTFTDTAVCIRVRSVEATDTTQDLWLLADDLLEQVDLVIKTLPHPLVSPVGLMGLSMQADGKTIPVLDPSALATQILTTSHPQPVAEPQQPDVLPASPYQPMLSTNRQVSTILVVDDAALVRRRVEASLANYGYRIQTCRDGLEAWTWLQSHPAPDLLITDIEMPNMDGFTLIDRARQAGMRYPIIVISSRLSEEWSKEARRIGATDYLTKGFTTTELIQKVQALLATRSPVGVG